MLWGCSGAARGGGRGGATFRAAPASAQPPTGDADAVMTAWPSSYAKNLKPRIEHVGLLSADAGVLDVQLVSRGSWLVFLPFQASRPRLDRL